MKNSLETKLGIFVVLAIFASLFVVEMVGGLNLFKGGYLVSAQFANIQDLKVGDAVRIAGVPVGRVERIDLVDSKVRVTMRLDRGTVVKTDAVAMVRFVGLMGQNYVAIDAGSAAAPAVVAGATLNSAEQADLNTLMTKLDNAALGIENLTKSFTGDKVDNLFGPVTDFLKQNSGPLHTSITNLAAISGQIASGEGTVGRLIYSKELYDATIATVTSMQTAAANLQVTIADARDVLGQLNAGKGTLGRLVKDETLYTETTGAMTNLHQILLKINNGQGTVGKLVNDQEFYRNARLTLQKVDKATDSLEDTGPLSVIGTMANSLF